MAPCPLHRLAGSALAAGCLAIACSNPDLVVGKVVQEQDQNERCPLPDADGGAPAATDLVVDVPWSTGFENGFCDYQQAGGYCYSRHAASFKLATAPDPVHEGTTSVAFTVHADSAEAQTRCVRKGVFPVDAVYGAWFYIPKFAENANNWNLMYFQGAPQPGGLWDVSIANRADGTLRPYIFSHRGQPLSRPDPSAVIPIGEWFQLEFRLLRANDATGAVSLTLNGKVVQEASSIVTDAGYDAHQWYVGNLADDLTPADSTIYVDDVTIREP